MGEASDCNGNATLDLKQDCQLLQTDSEESRETEEKLSESSLNSDEQCGCKFSCCGQKTKKYAFNVFQSMATPQGALAILCIANMAQQTIINGLIGVNISTLEKRFELRSTETGIIASSADIGIVVTMIFISLYRDKVDKPRWIGWGVFLCGLGCFLFALPHFIAPKYQFLNIDITNYCGNVTEPDCNQSSIRNYRYIFIVAISIIGLSICPMYAHGVTYLDENVKKKNSAMYNSIYFATGGIGPALGFLCGGAALELYTDFSANSDEITIDSTSYLWVGAWWTGFLFCGGIMLLISIPILMLPKYLPGTAEHRKNRNVEVQENHLIKTEINEENEKKSCQVGSDILLLLKNKAYVFTTLAVTTNCALIYGFNTFGAKYLESVFGLTPFHSCLLFGIAAIFANTGAQITSGIIIKKFNLSVEGIIKYLLACGVFSAFCSIGFIVHCQDIDLAGGTVPYPNSTFELTPYSSCNEDCGCSTDRYQPVCGEGITYFSPCFAGCQTQISETSYTNCSCVSNLNSTENIVISSENCDRNACQMIIPFLLIIFLCFFSSLLTYSPALQVTMRCVPFNKRVKAISLQEAFVRLVGIIPGRVIVGAVLDVACVSWSTECGEQGSCRTYRRLEVARNNTILLLIQTVVCAIFYFLVYLVYKPAGSSEQKEENDNEII
uniref:solute carrier organic anion transporter family member 4A1-like n=1 Tax=Styela clava TaxID=7725 RepID=UPI00193958FB|nr:solute carrier organic anion transporter family member 4A1-like [Styela clava]